MSEVLETKPLVDESFDVKLALTKAWPAAKAAYELKPGDDHTDATSLRFFLDISNPTRLQDGNPRMGFVAVDGSQLTISFRGTENVDDWVHDLGILTVPYTPTGSILMQDNRIVGVHDGFYELYKAILQALLRALYFMPHGVLIDRVLITGHSMGGALATLASFDVFAATNINPTVITFASPRVGTPAFASLLDQHLPNFFRVTNPWDIVPEVPVPPVFKHVGREVLLRGCPISIDPVRNHALNTYREGLEVLSK